MTLNKHIRNENEREDLRRHGMVELVAGPGCGMKVKWPHPDKVAAVTTAGGVVDYELEQGGTSAHPHHPKVPA